MKIGQRVFILIVAALISGGCKQSNPKNAVENAADFPQMKFADVKAIADKGDSAAQFELGERFYYGSGVLKDSTEAVEWWRKAAIQNFPPAEYELGLALGRGDGVPKDKEEGGKWCRMAADAKLPVAEDFEGIAYTLGKTSVAQNYSEAFRWFKAAADQNYPSSQYRLGLCYRDGIGTTTNVSEAVVWFQRAASNGVANAQVELGTYYRHIAMAALQPQLTNANDKIIFDQNTEQNLKIAAGWLMKAANQNYEDGQLGLSLDYATGWGVTKNHVEAYKWFFIANSKDEKYGGKFFKLLEKNKITFTPEEISEGERRAKEFIKTNQVTPNSVKEINGL